MNIFEPVNITDKTNRGGLRNVEFNNFSDSYFESELNDSTIATNWIRFILSLVCIILFSVLLKLQIKENNTHRLLAEDNRIRTRLVPAPRGIIYDKNGESLVRNEAGYSLVLLPSSLPRQKQLRNNILLHTSKKFDLNLDDLMRNIDHAGLYSSDYIILKDNLSHDDAIKFQVDIENYPGLFVLAAPKRKYDSQFALSHIVGYIGKISPEDSSLNSSLAINSEIGKLGVEKQYDQYLRGVDGKENIEVDSQGRFERTLSVIDAKIGNSVHLTLDKKLQEAAYNSLINQITANNSKAGTAIAIKPSDGSILAMVSIPDFNNNDFVDRKSEQIDNYFKDDNHPLVNRAISGTYPSGSSIKPVVASLALDNNVVSPTYSFDTPPEIKIGQFTFPDWKDHGLTDIRKAIAESNNIFFYALGGGYDKIKGLGIDRLSSGLSQLGFGSKTGVDITGESKGLVPNSSWKKKVLNEKWYIGDTYYLAIGQGYILVTPIQLLRAISSIANGGNLVTPHVLDNVTDELNNTVYSYPIKEKSNNISKSNLQIVKEGMQQAAQYGSARSVNPIKRKDGSDVSVAAKTGTAQFDTGEQTHSWFVAFAPIDNPEIAIITMIEKGGEGFRVALPVARDMLNNWFNR